MLTEDIDARVRHIICDQIGAPEDDVLPEKHLIVDLGFDSLDCRQHWYSLPMDLRNAIWRAYVPGQERTGKPSAAYVAAARAVQEWIAKNHPPNAAQQRLI